MPWLESTHARGMPVQNQLLDLSTEDFTRRLESFLIALSPSLAPFASKLIDAGVTDVDTFRELVASVDEAVCSLADDMGVPAFSRQLLRAGLRRLRESGWRIESLTR